MYSNRGPRGGGSGREAPPTPEQLRSLQLAADDVAHEVRLHLSDAFAVEATVVPTPGGPRAAISVHPPEAPPVAVGFSMDELEGFSGGTQRDLAIDLVASAVERARTSVSDRFLRVAE